MNPIERFQALLDGKKLKLILSVNGSYLQLSGTKLVAFDGIEKRLINNMNLGCIMNPETQWEIYEEPKPEIKLTPEMVGRSVKLRNGDIIIITKYSKMDNLFSTAPYVWDSDGKLNYNRYSPYTKDIIEVLL